MGSTFYIELLPFSLKADICKGFTLFMEIFYGNSTHSFIGFDWHCALIRGVLYEIRQFLKCIFGPDDDGICCVIPVLVFTRK